MNSCPCCTCEELLESLYHPESRASGGFCPPCSLQEPHKDTESGMVHKTWSPSNLHGSFDWQRKLLKGAEENQVVPEIVWACSVTTVLQHSSALLAQVAAEKELGPCSPTVFEVNIMIIVILLNAVRIWGKKQHSILHKSSITAS